MEKGKVIVGQHPIKHTDGAVLDDQRAAAFYTEYMNKIYQESEALFGADRNERIAGPALSGHSEPGEGA